MCQEGRQRTGMVKWKPSSNQYATERVAVMETCESCYGAEDAEDAEGDLKGEIGVSGYGGHHSGRVKQVFIRQKGIVGRQARLEQREEQRRRQLKEEIGDRDQLQLNRGWSSTSFRYFNTMQAEVDRSESHKICHTVWERGHRPLYRFVIHGPMKRSSALALTMGAVPVPHTELNSK